MVSDWHIGSAYITVTKASTKSMAGLQVGLKSYLQHWNQKLKKIDQEWPFLCIKKTIQHIKLDQSPLGGNICCSAVLATLGNLFKKIHIGSWKWWQQIAQLDALLIMQFYLNYTSIKRPRLLWICFLPLLPPPQPESSDQRCSFPGHQCACSSRQVTLIKEDRGITFALIIHFSCGIHIIK